MNQGSHTPSRTSLWGLDLLNFFSADVHAGAGAFLTIYLQATRYWDPESIGLVLSAAGFGAIVAQTPVGWVVDRVHGKRELIILASGLVAACCLAILWIEELAGVVGTQALMGAAGAVFAPAIAAISLGLVGHARLDRRIGYNESFNHAVPFSVRIGKDVGIPVKAFQATREHVVQRVVQGYGAGLVILGFQRRDRAVHQVYLSRTAA